MPALSYKERFCDYVRSYSKTQSIRAFRKRPFKVGDALMHYFGMRTKHCVKLIPDTTCTDVQTIFIFNSGNVYIAPCMTQREAKRLLRAGEMIVNRISKKLTYAERDELAYNDGFRFKYHDPTQYGPYTKPEMCYKLMFTWWKETHSLPFTGQLIKWEKP
jgi:hypothetical protein